MFMNGFKKGEFYTCQRSSLKDVSEHEILVSLFRKKEVGLKQELLLKRFWP